MTWIIDPYPPLPLGEGLGVRAIFSLSLWERAGVRAIPLPGFKDERMHEDVQKTIR